MKLKYLFAILFMCCFSTATYAQVCKISNSNDNVEVFNASIVDGSKVEVTVGNDSQDISANVTIEVEVTYSSSVKRIYTGRKIAQPNQETVIPIPIDATIGSLTPKSVTVKKITGSKCM